MIDKNELRKKLIILRDSIENRDEKSNIIQSILCKQDFYKSARTVMIYSAIKSEVSTDLLIDKLFFDNKNLIFPKCSKNRTLLPIEIKARDALEKKTYGILEPISDKVFPKENIDLVILPAVAYDLKKNRLGYGGGYYDRFLVGFEGLKIGLCFKEILQKNKLPTGEFDIKVDIIITDDGIY